MGYDPGRTAGILGNQTLSTIRQLQRDLGLTVSGVASEEILAILASVRLPAEELPGTVNRTWEAIPPMPSPLGDKSLGAAKIYEKVRTSVFVVFGAPTLGSLREGTRLSQGSAVAISENHLLTNCHILEECPYIVVVQDEKVFPAKLFAENNNYDTCVLCVENVRFKPVEGIRSFKDLAVGEKAYTVGAPIGLDQTLGEGIVSGLRRYKGIKLVQTSAQISIGSSGGGLFDDRGNLIGITTLLLNKAQNINFAVAVEHYWEILREQ
jgi:S1-C subfamily serine protease